MRYADSRWARLAGGIAIAAALVAVACRSDDREADVIDGAGTAGQQSDASFDRGDPAGEAGHGGAGGQDGGSGGGGAGGTGGAAGAGGTAGHGGSDGGTGACAAGTDCSQCADYSSCARCLGAQNPSGLAASLRYLIQACDCEIHDGGAPICASACAGAGNYDCSNIDGTMPVTATCAGCLNGVTDADPCVAIWNAKCQADATCWSYSMTLAASCTKP